MKFVDVSTNYFFAAVILVLSNNMRFVVGSLQCHSFTGFYILAMGSLYVLKLLLFSFFLFLFLSSKVPICRNVGSALQHLHVLGSFLS